MNELYQKLPLDLNKRHFVVGDIHGRYDTFMNLLSIIEYNKETDIIYGVGDLIDRGPKSYEVLKHFEQPNHYTVRGNHEEMIVDFYKWQSVWLNNGGFDTIDSLIKNEITDGVDSYGRPYPNIKWLQEYCGNLPYVIDVGEEGEEHAFRLVHAEIPPLWNEDYLQRVLKERLAGMESMIWSRSTIEKALKNVISMKPSHYEIVFSSTRSKRNVFVGHTPIRKVMVVGDMTYLDTYRSRTMTMINVVTKEKFVTDVVDKNP